MASGRLNAAFTYHSVLFAEHKDLGLPAFRLRFVHPGIAHDCETVARFAQMGCSPVEDDGSRATFAGYAVSLEALAVGQIAAKNALVGMEPCPRHQLGIDGQAAFIFHVPAGYGCAVELGLQNLYLHAISGSGRSLPSH